MFSTCWQRARPKRAAPRASALRSRSRYPPSGIAVAGAMSAGRRAARARNDTGDDRYRAHYHDAAGTRASGPIGRLRPEPDRVIDEHA